MLKINLFMIESEITILLNTNGGCAGNIEHY